MKINYMGRRINGRFDSFKTFTKRVFRGVMRLGLVSAVGYSLFLLGGAINSTHSVEAQVVEAPSPILDRIMDCESGNGKAGTATHTGKNGQVLIKVNTNGTVDIGIAQINSVWAAQATKLGLDLTKEADNKAMAKWIYQNKGTGDWYSSAKCWQK